MTGEITLQGRVLAVGGLKEKLLAAKQHDMKIVLVPEENKDDMSEIEKEINLGDLKIIFVNSMDQVLKATFDENAFKKEPKSKTSLKTSKKKTIKNN